MSLLIALILHASAAPAETPPAPPDPCADLLAVDPARRAPLGPAAIERISARTPARIGEASHEIEELRAAVDRLVVERRITEAESQTLFANRVLGEYVPIFRKYVIAELLARGYDESQVVRFILNFDDAYGTEAQVDFAVAVARRMLMTVNDAIPTTIARGIDQFEEAAAAFGVDVKAYGRFTRVWTYVRTAHPATVVHYILASVRHAAASIATAVDEEYEREAARASSASAATPMWRWKLRDTAAAAVSTLRSRVQIGRDALGGLTVPEFIRHVEGLIETDEPAPGWFARLAATSDEFASNLELRPPYVWNHIVRQRRPYLGEAAIARLLRSRVGAGLDAEVRAAVEADAAHFAELRVASENVRRLVEAEDRARGTPTPLTEMSPTGNARVALDSLRRTLSTTYENEAFETTNLANAIEEAFSKAPRLGAVDFVAIAHHVITSVFAQQKAFPALGAARALMAHAKLVGLERQQARELIALMKSFSLAEWHRHGRRRIDELAGSAGNAFCVLENWIYASAPPAAPDVTGIDLYSENVRAALAGIRALLLPAESAKFDDASLFRGIVGAPKPVAKVGAVSRNINPGYRGGVHIIM